MDAPEILYALLKCTSSSLPKREELWLRSVLALPNASRMGLVCSGGGGGVAGLVCGGGGSWRQAGPGSAQACRQRGGRTSSTRSSMPEAPARPASSCSAFLVVSVLPAPDSPLTTSDWLRPSRTMARNASAATL
jgi:hypothetical protein